MTWEELDDDRYIVKTFRVNEDELEHAQRYQERFGFPTWSDFVRTAIANFCDALEFARLGWQPPEVNDDDID